METQAAPAVKTQVPFIDTETAPPGFVRVCRMKDYLQSEQHVECTNTDIGETETLNATEVLDLRPLSKLFNLAILNVSVVSPGTLAPFGACLSLKRLEISDAVCGAGISDPSLKPGILDLSIIKNQTGLRSLTTKCIGLTGFEALVGLSNLTEIVINFVANQSPTDDLFDGLRKYYTDKVPSDQIRTCLYHEDVKRENPLIYCGTEDRNEAEKSFRDLIDTSPIAQATKTKKLELYVENDRQADLKPLRNLPHLKELTMQLRHEADLSPIGELKDLENLSLIGADCNDKDKNDLVFDVSFLKNMPNLKELYVCIKTIGLDSFASLTSLRVLSWQDEAAKIDYSSVRHLKDLREFYTTDRRFTSLKGFEELRNLEKIDISGTAVSDLTPIQGLRKIRELVIGGTAVTDLSPLADWGRIYSLGIFGTQIRDLSPLSKIRYLGTLYAEDTPITDYSVLAKIGTLYWARTGEKVDSIVPFTRLKSLTELTIGRFPIEEIPLVKKLPCCQYVEPYFTVSDTFSESEKKEIYDACHSAEIHGKIRPELDGID